MSSREEGPVAGTTGRRLLALLGGHQSKGRLPSVVAGVVRNGELVWSGGYGEVPGGAELTDVQYRIGSITKTFTAVLVLQLVRDWRLDLAQPASDVLGDVGYADRSLRALLSHSSGMQAEPNGSWWERSDGVGWDELVAAHDGSGQVFPAGQQYHYSNLGFALLGEVAARVHGTTWFDAVREHVLDPLGLRRTTYLPDGACAQGFSVDPYAGTTTPEPATDTRAMAPAGQLWSTVGDLASYNAFLGAGHPDVLELSWLELAAHPQSGDRNDGLEYAYGLGFQLHRGGSGSLVGHTGSMPGFLAACLVDRARGTGAVLLSNATSGLGPGGLAQELVEELERCEPTLPQPWAPTTRVPGEVAGALGVWHWGNTMFALSLRGDVLELGRGDDVWCRFEVRDGRIVGTTGYLAGETLDVVRRDDGSVSHLVCATFVLTRTPYDPEVPIPGGVPAG
ncbi:MAG: serine hydrolase domain-containing protein [Nocardioides sp.]